MPPENDNPRPLDPRQCSDHSTSLLLSRAAAHHSEIDTWVPPSSASLLLAEPSENLPDDEEICREPSVEQILEASLQYNLDSPNNGLPFRRTKNKSLYPSVELVQQVDQSHEQEMTFFELLPPPPLHIVDPAQMAFSSTTTQATVLNDSGGTMRTTTGGVVAADVHTAYESEHPQPMDNVARMPSSSSSSSHNDADNDAAARWEEEEDNDDDDDDELRAMKRAAYHGNNNGNGNMTEECNNNSQLSYAANNEPPLPRVNETWPDYAARTALFWNDQAKATLRLSGWEPLPHHVNHEAERMMRAYLEKTTEYCLDETAFVVSIVDEEGRHPSDLQVTEVQAELVGNDFRQTSLSNTQSSSTSTPSCYAGMMRSSNSTTTTTTAVGGAMEEDNGDDGDADDYDNNTAEATVIDSAPLQDLMNDTNVDLPAWKCAAEARVLEDHDNNNNNDNNNDNHDNHQDSAASRDQKPAARTTSDDDCYYDAVALADQEAQVVGVQDEIHPADFELSDARAELVGTDHTYVIGSHYGQESGRISSDEYEALDEALVVVEEETSVDWNEETVVEGSSDERKPSDESPPTKAFTSTSYPQSPPPLEPLENVDERCENDTDSNDSWMHQPVGETELPTPVPLPPKTVDGPDDDQDGDQGPLWLRETPPRRAFGVTGAAEDVVPDVSASGASEQSTNSGASLRHLNIGALSRDIARSTTTVMEALFGDSKPPFVCRRSRSNPDDAATSVRPRTLLPWSVIYSQTKNIWITTLQTNQRALEKNNVAEASRSLRAFSLPSENQALCLARAWTPPKMDPFSENANCHICQAKFAVFRRACHCRNCGVCICKDCSVQWPQKMLPESYNLKRENSFNICKACDWLCNAFRLALLEGKRDMAVALHATGNVNLTTPFANVKGELFFPVHCAVIGGDISLIQWLVDSHCCPIKSVRVSGRNNKEAGSKYTPIVTSKGRSLLGIAMEGKSVDIVRYLVVNKGISLASEKDLTPLMLMHNLDAVLRLLPDPAQGNGDALFAPTESPFNGDSLPIIDLNGLEPIMPDKALLETSLDREKRSLRDEASDFGAVYRERESDEGETDTGIEVDECIICFDGKIDCVATPCGHQICCLRCSENIVRCPVCAADCEFMRIFKP